jgi:peroxiredoxin
LRLGYEEFVKRDAEIISIGPDSAKRFKEYWQSNDLPFIGLPDERHRVLKLYEQKVNIFKFGRMPAQMIIDKAGNIRYAHYGANMADIPSNEDLLKNLEELNLE